MKVLNLEIYKKNIQIVVCNKDLRKKIESK